MLISQLGIPFFILRGASNPNSPLPVKTIKTKKISQNEVAYRDACISWKCQKEKLIFLLRLCHRNCLEEVYTPVIQKTTNFRFLTKNFKFCFCVICQTGIFQNIKKLFIFSLDLWHHLSWLAMGHAYLDVKYVTRCAPWLCRNQGIR